MQPLQLACDAKPGLVEMANLRLRHALADESIDLPQLLRLLSDPGDDVGRTRSAARRSDRSAPARPDPRDELLDVEVDRHRLDALAILGGRRHATGKRRPGHAPAM